jgi:hypothetical protein
MIDDSNVLERLFGYTAFFAALAADAESAV